MNMENALALTITAFDKVKPTSRKKRETLAFCFEQVEGILKDYMETRNVPYICVDLKTKEALVVEPIPREVRQFWVEQWLNGELSTRQFRKWLYSKWQNTYYPNFADFLRDVEAWLLEKKGKRRVVCYG